VTARLAVDGKIQCIATHQTTWRMYQDVVAHRITLWVQALQNAQRSAMNMASDGTVGFQPIVDIQLRMPSH
jgi:hypothetical protein